MKLLIATGIYPPSIGGPATYSKLLNDELPKRGIDVAVVSFDAVRHLPKIIRHLVYFGKILLQTKKADIIYAQDPVSVGLPAYLASKLTDKRFLLRIPGDYAWEQGVQRFGVKDLLDEFSKKPANAYSLSVQIFRIIENFVAKRAEKIIVPSKYLRKIVMRWGIPEEKISVIYNAFEGLSIYPDESRPKVQLYGKTIVSSGRLVPWKGFMSLVETMIELNKKFPDLKLCIVGDGPERGVTERRIKQLELGRNVYMVGNVSQAANFEYIRQARVFVLNTGYEGFSHQILEVMAIGTPLVTTDVGGNPEIVESGRNGLLFPYNDKKALSVAVEKMFRDEDFAHECSARGKETVAQFTKEKMIDSLIELLNK